MDLSFEITGAGEVSQIEVTDVEPETPALMPCLRRATLLRTRSMGCRWSGPYSFVRFEVGSL